MVFKVSENIWGRHFLCLLTQKFPENNYELTTLKMWQMLEIAFIRSCNLTFDRYVFFSKNSRKGRQWSNFIVLSSNSSNLQITLNLKIARRLLIGTFSSPTYSMTIYNTSFWEIQLNRNEHLASLATWKWAIRISRRFHLTTAVLKRYNSSNNFAARILVYNNTTELHSIEKRMASAGILDKTGHQHTVKFAPLWVRNVTTVAF